MSQSPSPAVSVSQVPAEMTAEQALALLRRCVRHEGVEAVSVLARELERLREALRDETERARATRESARAAERDLAVARQEVERLTEALREILHECGSVTQMPQDAAAAANRIARAALGGEDA